MHRLSHYYQFPIVRFLAVGVSNTVIVYGVYLLALLWMGFRPAYWCAFGVGLIYLSILNIHHTFSRALNPVALTVYGIYYFCYALVNVSLIAMLIERYSVAPAWAPLSTIVVLTPIHYLLSKYLIGKLSLTRAKG